MGQEVRLGALGQEIPLMGGKRADLPGKQDIRVLAFQVPVPTFTRRRPELGTSRSWLPELETGMIQPALTLTF